MAQKQPEEKETGQFDAVDLQTEKLSHPTANRAKPPQRRPPSGQVAAVQVSDSILLIFLFFMTTFTLLQIWQFGSEEYHNEHLS